MSDQRRGLQTSEFWIAVLTLLMLALAPVLGIDVNELAAALASAGYAGARGLAKASASAFPTIPPPPPPPPPPPGE